MSLLDPKILKDSSSYHLLKELVRIDEARSILVLLATDCFGELSETQTSFIENIRDYDHLLRLCKKVRTVASWDELVTS